MRARASSSTTFNEVDSQYVDNALLTVVNQLGDGRRRTNRGQLCGCNAELLVVAAVAWLTRALVSSVISGFYGFSIIPKSTVHNWVQAERVLCLGVCVCVGMRAQHVTETVTANGSCRGMCARISRNFITFAALPDLTRRLQKFTLRVCVFVWH